jgi:cytochrome c
MRAVPCAALALAGAFTSPADAAGDALRGQQAYESRCGGCHSLEADRVGPRHAGLFGRKAGSVAGFNYSPALAGSQVVWNARTLERWLADPEALIPGQRMGYRLDDAQERADIASYLAAQVPGAPVTLSAASLRTAGSGPSDSGAGGRAYKKREQVGDPVPPGRAAGQGGPGAAGSAGGGGLRRAVDVEVSRHDRCQCALERAADDLNVQDDGGH